MIVFHDIEQGSLEWLQIRRGKFTGSNAHKLLINGAIDYALTETGNFRGNYWTKRGHILEGEAIELYETITRRHVNRPGFITNTDFSSCGYSPDGIAETRLIEVKCFDEKEHMKLIRGDIKFRVLAQIHFGLLISGLKVADLIAYNPKMDNPKEAFKIIELKAKRNINNNFKRILA